MSKIVLKEKYVSVEIHIYFIHGTQLTHWMMQSNVNNHGRNVELTIRYNFNTSKSRYKGTGAGQTEKGRF